MLARLVLRIGAANSTVRATAVTLALLAAFGTAQASADPLSDPVQGGLVLSHTIGDTGSGDGEFSGPSDVAVDPATGDFYVTDTFNDRIEKFDSAGHFLFQVGTAGCTNGEFNRPIGVAVDPSDGTVYVADSLNRRIQAFTSAGRFLTSWGGNCIGGTSLVDPTGVAVDPTSHEVYVSDWAADVVKKYDANGNFISQWGSDGGNPGQFSNPADISVDPTTGDVYVADHGGARIEKFDSSGNYIAQYFPFAGYAWGVAVDPATSDLYGSDDNNDVWKFDSHLNYLESEGGLNPGYTWPTIIGAKGLAVDPASGALYAVANDTVEKWSLPIAAPGPPSLSSGTSPQASGNFTISWTPTTVGRGGPVTYTLEQASGDGTWSAVASGLSSPSYTFGGSNLTESDGTWSFRVRATANGDDSSYAESDDVVVVDQTPPNAPTLTIDTGPEQSPSYTDPNTGITWYGDSALIDVSANGDPPLSDGSPGVGVDPLSFSATVSTGVTDGDVTISRTVSDLVGNTSSPGRVSVHVDDQAPAVGFSDCPTTDLAAGSTQSIHWSASDSESGLATPSSGTVALDTSSGGSHTVKAPRAVDNVGNVSVVASCTYTVALPNDPSSLAQYEGDGVSAIPSGGTASSGTVVLSALEADESSPSDWTFAEFEVEPAGTAFSTDNSDAYYESIGSPPAPNPHTGSVTVTGLQPGTGYHWRVRTIDSSLAVSGWAYYSGSAGSTGADFTVAATPKLSFDLSSLPAKNYGDPSFSVAGDATSNSPAAITFETGRGSVGCTVTSDGTVTITGAAVGADQCIIEASQAPSGSYPAAGPVAQGFNIDQATVHVDADPASTTYGSADPTPTDTLRTADFKNGDTASSSGISGDASCSVASHSPNAGVYSGAISCDPATLAATNYKFATGTAAALTIDPATLHVDADDQVVTYGTAPTLTATLRASDFKFSDTAVTSAVKGSANCSESPSETNVGSYNGDIVCDPGTLSATNYKFAAGSAGDLTINHATLTVTANDKTITYGQSIPALDASIAGFQRSDTQAGLSGSPSCTTTVSDPAAADSYTITCRQGTLADPSGNYKFAFAPGTLTVNKATLTVTADDETITYGDPMPTLTYKVSGFQNGDKQSVLSGGATCASSGPSDSPPGPAGSYAITCSQGTLNAGSNYEFAFANATLTINKKPVTLGYTGDLFFSTGSATSTTAELTLQATLTPGSGGTPDLSKAAPVTFLLYKSTNFAMTAPDQTCTATSVDSTGVASCTLPSLGIDNWTVIVSEASNGYFAAPQSDPVVLTVYQPTTDKQATGGGWVTDRSADVSTVDDHGNFGLAVRYKSKSTTPSGQSVYVFRGSDGYDYVVKSNSWQGGGLSFGTNTAGFSGKANVTAIDPSTGMAVSGIGGGNYTYRVDVADDGSTGDTYAISVYDSTGSLYHQAGTSSTQLPLGGGNIVVHTK